MAISPGAIVITYNDSANAPTMDAETTGRRQDTERHCYGTLRRVAAAAGSS